MSRPHGADALRAAVAAVEAGELDRRSALLGLTEADLDDVLHPTFQGRAGGVLTTGVGAAPGAAVGRAYVTPEACLAAFDRGEAVVLVRTDTSPADESAFRVAEGILTARGGLASHAAVVARGWGLPAVVGADAVVVGATGFSVGDVHVREGEVISLDGTTGEVVLGERGVTSVEVPPELEVVLGWADEVRAGRVGVLANADTAADAALAVSFGAEGVGLCRTEHMFLAEDRLPLLRAVLAADPSGAPGALEELRAAQRDDFAALLRVLDGRPLTVRLLDPPLHELLPAPADLRAELATRGLSGEDAALLAVAEAWAEHNPMLGTRGVRLAALRPGLYDVQVRALVEAGVAELAAGGSPAIEVMIPFTVAGAELARARGWVEAAAASVPGGRDLPLAIGTMVETPRAALVAGELAAAADFFSVGTNDLTQLTYGFSRDDVERRLVPEYLAAGVLPANPFEVLDPEGVGALLRMAAERGRAARPGLRVGVCGEHGGDPASIAQLVAVPVDQVSCSPYRVPVARLAVAQALLASAPDGG